MQTFEINTSSKLTEVAASTPMEDLKRDLVEVERALAKLRVHAEILRLVIRLRSSDQNGGLGETISEDTQVVSENRLSIEEEVRGSRPSLREAILVALGDRGGRLRLSELYEDLDQRNWLPPGENARAQLSARLSKLAKQNQVWSPERGVWALSTTKDDGLG